MFDIWFIFDNTGNYLFRTSDKDRTNLELIPSNFNATYIIKNPDGFDSERNQNIHYDIQSDRVIFSDINSINNDEINEQIIINYGEILENINDLFEFKNEQTSISSSHTQQIESLQRDLDLVSTELSNLIKIFNNIFIDNSKSN